MLPTPEGPTGIEAVSPGEDSGGDIDAAARGVDDGPVSTPRVLPVGAGVVAELGGVDWGTTRDPGLDDGAPPAATGPEASAGAVVVVGNASVGGETSELEPADGVCEAGEVDSDGTLPDVSGAAVEEPPPAGSGLDAAPVPSGDASANPGPSEHAAATSAAPPAAFAKTNQGRDTLMKMAPTTKTAVQGRTG